MKLLSPAILSLLFCFPRMAVCQDRAEKNLIVYDKPLFGDEMMIVSPDTILVYLELLSRSMSERPCANGYRIAPITKYFQMDGIVRDFYISNNSIASRLSYDKGFLDGPCAYYYPNGNVMEKGTYTHNRRKGHWDYFFENGQKEKSVECTDSGYFLIDCYTKTGEVLASEGNGRFAGTVVLGNLRNINILRADGWVKNGVPDRDWRLYYPESNSLGFVERFDSGVFVKGISYSIALGEKAYTESPMSDVEGIHLTEYMDVYGQSRICSTKGLFLTGRSLLTDEYEERREKIKKIFKSGKYPDYSGWIVFDVNYDKKGTPIKVQVKLSSKNDALEADLTRMLSKLKNTTMLWQTKEGGAIPYEKFYVVLAEKNEIVLPEEVLYNARKVDIGR